MLPTHEDEADQCELDAVLIEQSNGTHVYVCYPLDATNEELKTMWIRSDESDVTKLSDHQ